MAGILHILLQQVTPATPPTVLVLTYSVDRQDVNIAADLVAAGWDGVSAVTANILIESTAKISASSTAVYAVDTGAFPPGSVINITNNGLIAGHGGKGGNSDRPTGLPGTAGGPALLVSSAINLTNNSVIGGGGGGGGSGGPGTIPSSPGTMATDGGSGGGGQANGLAGTPLNGYKGGDATLLAAGAGGAAYGNGGAGGNGGNYGVAGGNGANGYKVETGSSTPGGAGGAAGVAVTGNANIVWVVTGTVLGAII